MGATHPLIAVGSALLEGLEWLSCSGNNLEGTLAPRHVHHHPHPLSHGLQLLDISGKAGAAAHLQGPRINSDLEP